MERSFREEDPITNETLKQISMSPETLAKFRMTSPKQSKYADPKNGILQAFHTNSNTKHHLSVVNSLATQQDANSKRHEEKLPKMIPMQKNWDHPLYDDSKGGMRKSPSNGILSLFEVDRNRVMGT